MLTTIAIALGLLGVAKAHVAPYAPGMYCGFGNTGEQDYNSYAIVKPLYQLPFNQWWMHHVDNCDQFPPPAGEFLEIPAGGSFHVEIVSNRAKSSMSYGGRDASQWPDGATYPEDYHVDSCIISPNLHTQDRAHAAGTAFAIAYKSDLASVTPEDLTVFSVAYNTPFKKDVDYQVPAAMPACPEGGCICAWGWVPNGCGQPNMYMNPFKCKVTGATSTTPVAAPKPPVWCEGNPDTCTKGAKQLIYWHQAERNNIETDGLDAEGQAKSPGYNMKLGYRDGAQNDIFGGAPTSSAPSNTGTYNPGTGSGTGSSSSGSGTGSGGSTPSGSSSPSGSPSAGSGTDSTSGTPSEDTPPPSTTKKSTGSKCKPRPANAKRGKRSLNARVPHGHRRHNARSF